MARFSRPWSESGEAEAPVGNAMGRNCGVEVNSSMTWARRWLEEKRWVWSWSRMEMRWVVGLISRKVLRH